MKALASLQKPPKVSIEKGTKVAPSDRARASYFRHLALAALEAARQRGCRIREDSTGGVVGRAEVGEANIERDICGEH